MIIHINTKHKEIRIKNQEEINREKNKHRRDLENRKGSTQENERE